MAISEDSLKDAALMTIEGNQQCRRRSRRKIEAVIVDLHRIGAFREKRIVSHRQGAECSQDKVACRLLDVDLSVCGTSDASGLKELERLPFLYGSVRGRGDVPECFFPLALRQSHAIPAGSELIQFKREEREEVLSLGRLRLSEVQPKDSARLLAFQGCQDST